ncbi:esterase-like activity of phytase family protein [Saccharothrix lopnurensis]|uniref:Esterase-like activity of phytase family protein n=1 Tax=Saccharothrix lopnurensis TaxID=1670621 RepID=A0ABW1PBB0_9PSEU
MRSGRYTGRRWTYRLDRPEHAIGDAVTVDRNRLPVIERDGAQGVDARVKRVYLVDKRDRDRDGVLDKTLVADLLDVANPRALGGFGRTFTFPVRFPVAGICGACRC